MPDRGKGQSGSLQRQHELAGGSAGIFGRLARQHDMAVRNVMESILEELRKKWPSLSFRHRTEIPKREINERLLAVDSNLGQVLFVEKASIRPDGGVLEVRDCRGDYRVILVCESKHQGNDIEKIEAGIKQGRNKDQDLMVAGNAVERVHKNIQEFRNLMLGEVHFPYVVFFHGSSFSTTTFWVSAPDGRRVKIAHDAGSLNRIDRVTASSYGMKINQNYCRNMFVKQNGQVQMLQAALLFFQATSWAAIDMAEVLWDIARTSIDVLLDDLEFA